MVSHLHLKADELESLPLKATDHLTNLPMGTRLSCLQTLIKVPAIEIQWYKTLLPV